MTTVMGRGATDKTTRLPLVASAPPVAGDDRVYFAQGGSVLVKEGGTYRKLPHHMRHSPSGFGWGYLGSGPAELARCLLIDVLRDEWGGECCCSHPESDHQGSRREAFCASCEQLEHQRVFAFHAPHRAHPAAKLCCSTSGGEGREDYDLRVSPALYQAFKTAHVARWQDSWIISADEIRRWLADTDTSR